jgi:hypothetical protein
MDDFSDGSFKIIPWRKYVYDWESDVIFHATFWSVCTFVKWLINSKMWKDCITRNSNSFYCSRKESQSIKLRNVGWMGTVNYGGKIKGVDIFFWRETSMTRSLRRHWCGRHLTSAYSRDVAEIELVQNRVQRRVSFSNGGDSLFTEQNSCGPFGTQSFVLAVTGH